MSPVRTEADRVAAQVADRILDEDYALKRGQAVEVELLVASQHVSHVAPRVVEGAVYSATTLVLMVAAKPGGRLVRIPWHAIATIRDAVTPHPAN